MHTCVQCDSCGMCHNCSQYRAASRCTGRNRRLYRAPNQSHMLCYRVANVEVIIVKGSIRTMYEYAYHIGNSLLNNPLDNCRCNSCELCLCKQSTKRSLKAIQNTLRTFLTLRPNRPRVLFDESTAPLPPNSRYIVRPYRKTKRAAAIIRKGGLVSDPESRLQWTSNVYNDYMNSRKFDLDCLYYDAYLQNAMLGTGIKIKRTSEDITPTNVFHRDPNLPTWKEGHGGGKLVIESVDVNIQLDEIVQRHKLLMPPSRTDPCYFYDHAAVSTDIALGPQSPVSKRLKTKRVRRSHPGVNDHAKLPRNDPSKVPSARGGEFNLSPRGREFLIDPNPEPIEILIDDEEIDLELFDKDLDAPSN